jgi:hypothetical protein
MQVRVLQPRLTARSPTAEALVLEAIQCKFESCRADHIGCVFVGNSACSLLHVHLGFGIGAIAESNTQCWGADSLNDKPSAGVS